MKYENFDKAKDLVNKIQKHQENLDALSRYPEVLITLPSGGRIFTISTEDRCEHEYHKQAAEFVETIKADLQSRIDNLKASLELL